MKKIFKYFGLILSVALAGAISACDLLENEEQEAEVGLQIKVFSPEKVVAGVPMTINGSGFKDVTEIVFPEAVSVTDFKIVTDNMIRVTAPKGISTEGGKIAVRTAAGEEAQSKADLKVGNTKVSGYSKQAGEEITGGELLTVYGEDLEFISDAEFIDVDNNPLTIKDSGFYRKGTSTVVVIVPKNTLEGVYVGKLHTIDGKEFLLPELSYKKPAEEGHWELVPEVFWTNPDPDGMGAVSWSGQYRFGLDGTDGNNECAATFPEEIWNRIKTEKFYMEYAPASDSYQIRVTTGWWSVQWLGADNDIAPWNMADRIIDNEDGTFHIEVDFAEDPAILESLDQQHLLFTGAGYTVLKLYFMKEEWVGGGGHLEIVRNSLWKNADPDASGSVSWSGQYRFGLEGHDGNNECIATFPEDVWNQLKSAPFYMAYRPDAESYQIRVTTGWWSVQWLGADNDIAPWNMADRIIDNEDGTFSIKVDFAEDPAILDNLDEQHLLFTGAGYTVLELYTEEEVWVGPQTGPSEVVIWENPDPAGLGSISWSGTYRFGLDGMDGNNECVTTFPEDVWNKIKSQKFYMAYQPDAESYQIRVTTGWWSVQWLGADNDIAPWNMAERIIDNEDGTFHIEVDFAEDPAILESLDQQHLLFTGAGYTPLKLYFLE